MLFAIFMILFCLWCIYVSVQMYRCQIVHKYLNRRCEEICDANMGRIAAHDFSSLKSVDLISHEYNMTFAQMVDDWTKWSYKQFFPEEVK
jgi:hypothetical protein